jgi:hypothetical protein
MKRLALQVQASSNEEDETARNQGMAFLAGVQARDLEKL